MINKYPMDYEEYKKRVSELFLSHSESQSELENRELFLEKEEELIQAEYNSACYEYDHPEEYGE